MHSFLLQEVVTRNIDKRQVERVDSILVGNEIDDNDIEYPLHPPTGERTRKTYDFTSTR